MNILIYRNLLLQEVTTGAYFCDISNSTIFKFAAPYIRRWVGILVCYLYPQTQANFILTVMIC